MSEEEAYMVYVDLLRVHKNFSCELPYRQSREEFIHRINAINAKYNSLFCYMICEALRKWFFLGRQGLEEVDINKYYSDLWHLHKAFLRRQMRDEDWQEFVGRADVIDRKYNTEISREMLCVIADQIDRQSKQQGGE